MNREIHVRICGGLGVRFPGATRQDSGRSGSFEHEQFTFLGYTFRPRLAKSKAGHFFVSFSPAVSRDALVRIRHEIRGWRIHRRSDMTFAEIIAFINTRVAGWAAYYGRFYKSALYAAFRGLNVYLMRWAMRKYKSLKHSRKKAWAWLESVEERFPALFAHWRLGVTVSSH
jgi:RNA-directed DNA polymerase